MKNNENKGSQMGHTKKLFKIKTQRDWENLFIVTRVLYNQEMKIVFLHYKMIKPWFFVH
jgi:hypothetical protein